MTSIEELNKAVTDTLAASGLEIVVYHRGGGTSLFEEDDTPPDELKVVANSLILAVLGGIRGIQVECKEPLPGGLTGVTRLWSDLAFIDALKAQIGGKDDAGN